MAGAGLGSGVYTWLSTQQELGSGRSLLEQVMWALGYHQTRLGLSVVQAPCFSFPIRSRPLLSAKALGLGWASARQMRKVTLPTHTSGLVTGYWVYWASATAFYQ